MTLHANPDRIPPDAQVLASLAEGDEAARSAFYDRFAPHVYALARHLCPDGATAARVTEEVFVAVWRRPDLLATLAGPLVGRLLMLTYQRARESTAPSLGNLGRTEDPLDAGVRAGVVVGVDLGRSQTGDGSAGMPAPDTSATSTLEQQTDPAAERSCTVCPHAWSAHDALGRRFCTATSDVGWQRGCICRG